MGKYKQLAINISIFALNFVATKLITFLLVPLYTYYLSKAEFGLTDMSVTVNMMIAPLATLAIADAVIRFVIENQERSGRYVLTGVVVTFIGVFIVALLLPLLDLPFFGGLGTYRFQYLCTFATSSFFSLFGEIARGFGILKLIPLCAVTSSIITMGLAIVCIAWLNMGANGYFIAVSAGPAIGCLLYLTIGGFGSIIITEIRQMHQNPHKYISVQYADFRSMLRYSLPLVPNSLFWWIGTSINRFFLTGILGVASSGLFAAASKIPGLLSMVYQVFLQAWQISAFQEAHDNPNIFFSRIYSLLRPLMFMAASILMLFSPWIASLLLQKEFYQSWTLIPMLLIAILFNVLNSFVGTIYTTTMKTKGLMITTLIGAASSVILNAALIPICGIIGACYAMAISNILVFLLRIFGTKKILSFDMQWGKFFLATVLLGVQTAIMTIHANAYLPISAVLCTVLVVIEMYGIHQYLALLWHQIATKAEKLFFL
ncbi:oligosaccharide flippase family protein [Bifidobacterium cebidarum]|uniref:Polysaccharide biosynthesis protein n=1 Tax=Bifidobacterium cebidarum TaxID=2650773 RepID=A0A6I1G9A8_9BIFI|nr:oligosaccharide flippase family protein [Bifidobacterium cebidarum]KAB7788135.1 polysaccharide biosynthesis protein [Bifidobacterium cebidarum]